jgi:hypothetical protein
MLQTCRKIVPVLMVAAFFGVLSQPAAFAGINPISLDFSGSFASNAPVTCSVSAINTGMGVPYYKFFYRAGYGTSDYDSAAWVVMREYATENTCSYTFPGDSTYIVVARIVTDPNNEPANVPIIGGVVTVGVAGKIHVTKLSSANSAGNIAVNSPVTYTVTGGAPSDGTVYYKWFYRANYGTSAYDTSPWRVVQDYSTANTCNYTFPSVGRYIVVVRAVTNPNNEPVDLPIIGATADCGTAESAFIEVADPLSGVNPTYDLTAPAVPLSGIVIADTDFGTTQMRAISGERLRHEYSRLDPFNADRSKILLMEISQGEWRVYNAQQVPYDQTGGLITTLNLEEPRWDPTNPELIWGIRGFHLMTIHIGTNQETLIKDFSADETIGPLVAAQPDLYRITMQDEGEPSTDKRYWAFLIQGSNEEYRCRYLFTWDRQLNRVPGLYPLSAAESIIDWVGMSPKGTWVLVGADWDNAGNLSGLVMANKELTTFHQLDYATGHADVGLDSNGNEVIVMQGVRTDYVDLIPLSTATTPITDSGGSYTGTNRTPLMRLYYAADSASGLNSGVHISCNFPGYCVVSTYIEPGLAARNWLDRQIVLVRLDPAHPRVFYLAKVYGTRGAYWEETQAAITNDGARVVWATNWNQHVGEDRVWLMQLDMPTGWSTAFGQDD